MTVFICTIRNVTAGSKLLNRVSRFLCKNDSFFDESSPPGDRSIKLVTSTKASKVISSCSSELTSSKNSNSSSKEPSSSTSQRDSLDAKACLRK